MKNTSATPNDKSTKAAGKNKETIKADDQRPFKYKHRKEDKRMNRVALFFSAAANRCLVCQTFSYLLREDAKSQKTQVPWKKNSSCLFLNTKSSK